jgi:hypothetical protein
MLLGLSGATHHVLTAVTVLCDGPGAPEAPLSFCEKTEVRMHPLPWTRLAAGGGRHQSKCMNDGGQTCKGCGHGLWVLFKYAPPFPPPSLGPHR